MMMMQPFNRWGPDHGNLFCPPPSHLGRVIYAGVQNFSEYATILARNPAPRRGIFYFEIKVLKGGLIWIGLASGEVPLNKVPGQMLNCYSFGAGGDFYGHMQMYEHYDSSMRFAVGDVVGLGLNPITKELFFTKNGHRLELNNMYVQNGGTLFPCATLSEPGDCIEANFGPHFLFKYF